MSQSIILPSLGQPRHVSAPWSGRPTSVFGYAAFLDGSLVSIPPSRVRTTAASIDYMSRKLERPPQLCDDTADCMCNSKLHINDEGFLKLLRANAGKQICCAYCDDVFSRMILDETPQLQCIAPITIDGHLVPMERLALTAAVPQVAAVGGAIAAQICKDHLVGCCSRGKDCSHLHVCRKRMLLLPCGQKMAQLANAEMSAQPRVTTDAIPVPVTERVDGLQKTISADYY